jgi:hypothetical protein
MLQASRGRLCAKVLSLLRGEEQLLLMLLVVCLLPPLTFYALQTCQLLLQRC